LRLGGSSIAIAVAAAPLALGSCAAAQPVMACKDTINVYFSRGLAGIDLEALNQVLLAVSTLSACPAARATVTGHIDGAEIGMRDLGLSRARNVGSVMAKNGIARSRITVRDAGFGEPGRPTSPGIAEPKNRFVAISWG
jgi:outer membrane protein OmpA-like peptidoglycan-associated protein